MRGFLKGPLGLAVAISMMFTIIAESPRTHSAAATVRGANGRIAFSRFLPFTGAHDIYTIKPDGTGIRRLTFGGTGRFPAWSPDGRHIAYSVPNAQQGEAIWIMNAHGSDAHALTHPGTDVDERAVWSPDGKWIAFDRTSDEGPSWVDIWIVRANGTGATRVHSGGMHVSWAPSGQRISFEAFSFSKAGAGIWVMNLNTRSLRQIVSGDSSSEDPTWSPNGRLIAFCRGHQDNVNLGPAGIWVIHPDGTGLRQIARGRYWNPAWAPDGSRIAFSNGRSGFMKIWTIGANGNGLRQVTWLANVADSSPDWQPLPR